MNALQRVVAAWRSELARLRPGKTAKGGKTARRNPWPKCPCCHHRVPALCTTAEEGAEPCGDGIACGCCTGPHKAPKPAADGGKFTTSVEKA